MRHMKNLPFFRIFACLLVGLAGMLFLNPSGAQARKDASQGGGALGEGDPLDSNDYSGGGGGGKDIYPHLSAAGFSEEGGLGIFSALLLDQNGVLVLPFFPGGVPVIQVVIPAMDPPAVPHAD